YLRGAGTARGSPYAWIVTNPDIRDSTKPGAAQYHVATLLSLHEWFAENDNPVPGVLILDQPSQVYFPPDHVGEEVLESDDRILLLNIFKAIHRTLRRLDGKLQVIVMEHADLEDPAFSDHVVHRWRRSDGQALVPAAWIPPEAD
ncbi:DUF3732 domain-containing protein, partial [Kitasatospora sp. NPDC057692]|uniref:DUF3732 domain-containing protein n=1 Tax=Kitasatospora sp. NPDC057692 TaxID=3346215 RepID=UPI0036A622F0